ncbi:MAG: peroxiredoxin family protein [Haloechinothrix sp.]
MSETSGKTTTKRGPTGKARRPAAGVDRARGGHTVAQARSGGPGIGKGTLIGGALIALFAVVVLYFVYSESQNAPSETEASEGGSGYKHVAGDPSTGERAPDFTLSSSEGGEVSLSDFRGQSVLLYFQEGLMCQPCFEQITDLENSADALQAAGVDKVVSITSDPVGHLTRKADDMKLSTPILSDPDLSVIRQYDAHKYGMMNERAAGHSFLLVDPDGTITWRADYGGAPDYTMFLPTKNMLADLEAERTS